MSYLRTAILLAALTALFMGVGYLIGGQGGMLIALLFAAGMNLFAYWNSDKMVLRMYGAREADERSAPELYAMVRQLAANAGLPMPRVYIMENPQPNAFATGRNPENAAVAVTTGLMQTVDRQELAGVIAHELAHIRNHDGDRFISRYDEYGELSCRDAVSRAIENEMSSTGVPFVYLDCTHLPNSDLIKQFPNVYRHCLDVGVDITKDQIPIIPAASL